MRGVEVIGVRGIQLKVLKPVVSAIAIEVVDSLVGSQRPTEVLLHDPAVLKHFAEFAVSAQPSTSVSLRGRADREQTFGELSRAGVEAGEPTGIRAVNPTLVERAAARLAGRCHPHSLAAVEPQA
jgi:hypothetical protein